MRTTVSPPKIMAHGALIGKESSTTLLAIDASIFPASFASQSRVEVKIKGLYPRVSAVFAADAQRALTLPVIIVSTFSSFLGVSDLSISLSF
ncbi:hypothetical protein SDC9_162262 [bioreactor metagenome]|uniref:Uncharacterized protein n=1 Tax=bioreactor metagenome TaxID=1076179 RepID=A0A645FS81_9ZZZZ